MSDIKTSNPLSLLLFALAGCDDDLYALYSTASSHFGDAGEAPRGADGDASSGAEDEGEIDEDTTALSERSDGDGERDDCKLEGSDLGRTDLGLRVGGSSVRVSS